MSFEMWPEPLDVLCVAVAFLAVYVAIPKRGWKEFATRLREVRGGLRRHVFGPPAATRRVETSEGSLNMLRRRVRAEGSRLLELGVFGWVLALSAEEQGRRRRQEDLSQWQLSAAGLVIRHLSGEIDADRLEATVSQQGCPLAPKAARQVRPRGLVPRLEWLREIPAPVGAQPEASEDSATSDRRLQVQTLGQLRISNAMGDLTTDLLKRPTLAFIWQYLLVRALLNPNAGVSRDAVADELYAGVDLPQQRKRLSHRLYDFQKLVSSDLVDAVSIGELELRFELDRCNVDAARILDIADRVQQIEGLINRPTVDAINEVLPVASAEFLPDWDDLEQTVTGARGTSGDLVRQVRRRIEDARVILLASLGGHHLAARNSAQAVLALEEAYDLRPDRVDVVSKLIDALDAAGQRAPANELRGRNREEREQPA